MEERGAFWHQAINRKYGVEEGGWCILEVREGYGVGIWKELERNEFL